MPLKKLKLETVLIDILNQHTQDPTFNPLAVTYEGTELFDHKSIFDQFAYNYSSYTVLVSTIYQPTVAFFVNLWNAYVNETAGQLARQLAAMAAEYDPISNYDLTEKYADSKKEGKKTDTTTPTGGTHTETSVKRFGIESTTGENSDKTITESTPMQGTKSELEKTFVNDQTATIDSTTLTGNEVNEHFIRRFGNVGVTQNSQMITAEVEMRRISLLRDYVREFVCRYCFSVGGTNYECDSV